MRGWRIEFPILLLAGSVKVNCWPVTSKSIICGHSLQKQLLELNAAFAQENAV